MPISNCGGTNQPPCPPTNAAGTYSLKDMQDYGQACYEKGKKDAKPEK